MSVRIRMGPQRCHESRDISPASSGVNQESDWEDLGEHRESGLHHCVSWAATQATACSVLFLETASSSPLFLYALLLVLTCIPHGLLVILQPNIFGLLILLLCRKRPKITSLCYRPSLKFLIILGHLPTAHIFIFHWAF